MKTTYTWAAITAVVLASTAGDVLLALAMQRIGDLDELRARCGVIAVIKRVLGSGIFLSGVGFMAIAFFSLLIGLSWADVSLVGPASASLTVVSNALAAKCFLKEDVNNKRWLAILFVAAGVSLLAR